MEKISVVGLGKLGAPLAAVLASKGHLVTGVDLHPETVSKVAQAIAPTEESQLQEFFTKYRENIRATLSYEEAILNSDMTFLIVPTPSLPNGMFSNAYLLEAIEKVGIELSKKKGYHLVVVTSTVMPGSMEGEIQKALEASSGKKVGPELGLCYNPEFIALGTVIRDMLFPDIVLIGESDRKAGDILESIYRDVCEKHPPVRRMNFVNAEMTKISINTFVTTKISYANMLSTMCDQLPNADVDVITEAIGLDSRIGAKYLKGAIAFGGPCFPRDNIAFSSLAKALEVPSDLATATQKVNEYQNERLLAFLKNHGPFAKVGILGLSYKPGTDVVEESQGIRLANSLASQGVSVTVFDPMAMRSAKPLLDPAVSLASSLDTCLESSDAIVLMIPWPEFKAIDPQKLRDKFVLDCWRVLPKESFQNLMYLGTGKEKELYAKG